MSDTNQLNYSGPTTTAKSMEEGRLKVDVDLRKRRIIKKHLKKYHGKK